MKHILFFALLLAGQLTAPVTGFRGVLIQPPHICGAEYATRPMRVVVLGNSLAWSPPQPAYNWSESHGMDASATEADYAHIVCRALAERRHQSVALLVVQAWALESAIDAGQPWNTTYTDAINAFSPDALIVQYSDNVLSADGLGRFEATYSEVISEIHRAPGGSLICIGAWYDFAQKFNASIQAACAALGGVFVPIGDVFTAPNTHGASFDDSVNAGVGSHPNDLGMLEIARRVVLALE